MRKEMRKPMLHSIEEIQMRNSIEERNCFKKIPTLKIELP